jgi:hypothetical protein
MRRYWGLLFILCACTFNAFATDHFTDRLKHPGYYLFPDTTKPSGDTISDSAAEVKHRKYEIGLEGANDQTNHGLSNSKKLPYLEPSFTYTAKSGFYIEASSQFLLIKPDGGFDVFGLNPGWDISFNPNTTLNFNYQYYAFKSKTPNLVTSSLGNDLETYIDQYIGDLEGKFTADYDIYKKPKNNKQAKTPNDFIFTPDAQYDFEWDFGKNNSFDVIPEANFAFGTRNFYTQYSINKAADSTAEGLKVKKQTYSSNTNNSFGTLDYELILSLELTLGKFSIEPAFTYCYPLYNPTTSAHNPATFLGSIQLTYTIKSKK